MAGPLRAGNRRCRHPFPAGRSESPVGDPQGPSPRHRQLLGFSRGGPQNRVTVDVAVMALADHQLGFLNVQLVIRKGHHRDIDSYSAFLEADRKTATGLKGYLEERKIKQVLLCGLATDFCVAWTALDARSAGFETTVIEDA